MPRLAQGSSRRSFSKEESRGTISKADCLAHVERRPALPDAPLQELPCVQAPVLHRALRSVRRHRCIRPASRRELPSASHRCSFIARHPARRSARARVVPRRALRSVRRHRCTRPASRRELPSASHRCLFIARHRALHSVLRRRQLRAQRQARQIVRAWPRFRAQHPALRSARRHPCTRPALRPEPPPASHRCLCIARHQALRNVLRRRHFHAPPRQGRRPALRRPRFRAPHLAHRSALRPRQSHALHQARRTALRRLRFRAPHPARRSAPRPRQSHAPHPARRTALRRRHFHAPPHRGRRPARMGDPTTDMIEGGPQKARSHPSIPPRSLR